MDSIEQIALRSAFPLGLVPHVSIRCPLESVQSRGISLLADEDEFDSYQAAVLRLVPDEAAAPVSLRAAPGLAERQIPFGIAPAASAGDAVVFRVQRYDHEPADTLTVFLPSLVSASAAAPLAMDRILAALHLPPDSLVASDRPALS